MADEKYEKFNPKTGNTEARKNVPTTFPYMNPTTGAIEQRSLYPNAFTKLKENLFDDESVDRQRERHIKTWGNQSPTQWESAE